jgi:hypothetical protein
MTYYFVGLTNIHIEGNDPNIHSLEFESIAKDEY